MPVTSCSSNNTKVKFSGHVIITTIIFHGHTIPQQSMLYALVKAYDIDMLHSVITHWNPHHSETTDYSIGNLEVSCKIIDLFITSYFE